MEQLNSYDFILNTWEDSLFKALRNLITLERKIEGGIFPSCSEYNSLEYKEVCFVCKNCGFVECS